ncbi:MAG: dephospho-CoA kinase [Planctomycetota bacterium]|nr:dephospho-CoA kinase [Planctomycetota bacterium]MEC8512156.1 dephospho-CoA kinase [Planctomycetota bacterium]
MSSPPEDPSERPRKAPGIHVFGVLGGVASGKSAAAAALAGRTGRVASADRAAHEALQHPEVVARIVARHGREVLDEDGRVERAALAARVFEDAEARKELEGWIHPRVREMLFSAFEAAVRDGVPRLVLDVPLLLENAAQHGLLELCDTLVFVDASIEERDRRAVRDRGWEPGEVARRERAQLPLDAKRERADFILPNDHGHAELVLAVQALLDALGLPD